MSARLRKWNAAVLAVAIVAVFAALFALATVTSNAADLEYDENSRTYTMTDCTSDVQINLDSGTTTTIVVSGENKLTKPGPCISGSGNLVIKGEGTLDVANGFVGCNDFTIKEGAKLIVGIAPGLSVSGNAAVDNAEIELRIGFIMCGNDYKKSLKHVFNKATIKTAMMPGLMLNNDTVMTDCDVTIQNGWIGCNQSADTALTINGGIYNISQVPPSQHGNNPAIRIPEVTINNAVITANNTCEINALKMTNTDLEITFPPLSDLAGAYLAVKTGKATIKDSFIKANSRFESDNLEMTDTDLEITVPEITGGSNAVQGPALSGTKVSISGSKVNIAGSGFAGISAEKNLTIKNNTEVNIQSRYAGIISENVQIIHSGGKIQATDPQAIAAVVAMKGQSQSSSETAGTLTLKAVEVQEPAGGKADKVKVNIDLSQSSTGAEAVISAITDGKTPAKSVLLKSGHSWDSGKVTKQPTATSEGVRTYTCDICGATKTEAIPKQDNAAGEDGTAFGKNASLKAAEAALFSLPNDNDPAGTKFGLLRLKATKTTGKSIKLTWKKVPGATQYILYANKCGKTNKYKKLKTLTGTKYTAAKVAGAKIKKGTYYKFILIAADSDGKVISTSKTVHAATKGGKVGNNKSVKVSKSVINKAKKLKKGKTLKLKAKAKAESAKLKVKNHRKIKYETSNAKVAKVNSKGVVKGVGKGSCYVYAYAQNGVCARIKVKVR